MNEGYIKFILPHIKDEWLWGEYECKCKKNSKINEILIYREKGKRESTKQKLQQLDWVALNIGREEKGTSR